MKEVFLVSFARTPVGSFNGSLTGFSAVELGAIAIRAALERSGLVPGMVQELYMGNVVSANLGQAPARQAALKAGLPEHTVCTTVNKVCASGMKAVMLAAQSIMLGINEVVVAGGMESMTNIPYYLEKARFGYRMGNGQLTDGLLRDALWDCYKDYHMGNAAEVTAREMHISRKEQDEYAVLSYTRSAEATSKGLLASDIVPVSIPSKNGPVIFNEDEEFKNVKFDKIPQLKPVFDSSGTITAANASTINDGAAAFVLVSGEKVKELGLKPMARLAGFADAEQSPEWFTTAPSLAIPKAIERAGLHKADISLYEINEAFAVVALANCQKLGISVEQTNILGGAVSLGHPLGASGTRIMGSLLSALRYKNQRYGAAGICNGGGGASAVVLENLFSF